MTAMKFKNKLNVSQFVKTRIKTNLITNKKIATVICILHAIGFPLIVGLLIYSEYYSQTYRQYVDVDFIIIASVISGIIALLAGFVVALNVFKYLYKKSTVDMNLSLPLTSKQRFLTDYFTGLAIYLLPALCAWLIGDLIGLFGINLIDDMIKIIGAINKCGIIVIFAMILFYTLTVFCVVCCGNLFETILSSALLNIVIPLFLYIFGMCICVNQPFGVIESDIMLEQIYFTSPVGCMIFLINIIDFVGFDFEINTSFTSFIISIIVYIAVIFAISYFLYKKRKAESVSKPYVYKSLYYLITFAMLFIIIFLIAELGQSFIGAIFISAIIYFLIEVITKRGFKRFGYSVLKFVLTVASVFIIIILSKVSGGFGIYKYVPRASAVSSVTIHYYGDLDGSDLFSYDRFNFSDKSIIKSVINMQKQYIEEYENRAEIPKMVIDINSSDNTTINNSLTLEIVYNMKNGNIVSREYSITYDDAYEILAEIYTSDEFAEYAEILIRKYYSTSEISLKEAKTMNLYDLSFDKEVLEEFINAYTIDLKDMTTEDFYSAQIIGYIFNDLQIRDSFKNTIDFIKKYEPTFNVDGDNFSISDFKSADIRLVKDVVPVKLSYDYRYYKDEKYISVGRDYYYYNVPAFSVKTNSSDLEKLINVSKNVYNDTVIGGTITIYSRLYYIPLEYKDLFEKVYNSMQVTYYYDNYGNQYYIDEETGEHIYTGN